MPPSVTDANFIKAQSLFHPAVSITQKLDYTGYVYLNKWNTDKLVFPKVRTLFDNISFCLGYHYPGHGFAPFIYQSC